MILGLFFAAPLGIILLYSVHARGVYGGIAPDGLSIITSGSSTLSMPGSSFARF